MGKEVISPKQASKMLIVFIIGSSTLFIMGLEAEMDIWIAILVAIAGATIFYCIYARILSFLPKADFYSTLETLLTRPVTVVIVSIYTLFLLDYGSEVLTNYRNFVSIVGLTETPILVISISMILVCAIAVKKGVEVLGHWSQTFIVVIVGFILLTIPLMISNADFTNIQPILKNGLKPIFKGALGVITFPLADIFVFLFVFPAFEKGASRYKAYLKALYIAGGLLLMTSTLNVMILTPAYAQNVTYPTYQVLSIVKLGNFLNRLEVIAAAVFCMSVFFKICIFLLATCKAISYIFKVKDYTVVTFPVALMMVNLTIFTFTSITEFEAWSFKVWPYYSVIFTFFIPLFILIALEIRYRILKSKGKFIMEHNDKFDISV